MAAAASAKMIIVVGPSGSGKSTLISQLMKEFPSDYGFSVSHTTRGPRPGEVDGVNYHFTTREAIMKEIEEDKFIEHAEYSGNHYGTSKRAIHELVERGRVCLLDIDMQGARSIKSKEDLKESLCPMFVFVRTPSIEELERRLRSRGDTSETDIERRLSTARGELLFVENNPSFFDSVVVNDVLSTAFLDFKSAIGRPSSSS